MRSKPIAAVGAMFLATACTQLDPVSLSPDPAFGETVKYNTALQVIDPDPVYPEDAAQPGDSGEKGAAAVERYRTDQVNARHLQGVAQGATSALSTTEGTQTGGPR